MTSISISSPVYHFSPEKILKSMNRFNIPVSKTELDNLIKNCYAVKDVVESLVRNYNPPELIACNLNRFVERYWDTNFPDHLSVDRLITEMVSPILEEKGKIPLDFDLYIDLFYKILFLSQKIDLQLEIDNNTDFYKELVIWLPNLFQSFQTLDKEYNKKDIWGCYTDVQSFISKYFKQYNDGVFVQLIDFVKATLLFNTGFKIESFDYLDKIKTQYEFQEEILLYKANLLKSNYDDTLFLQLLLDIQIYVNTTHTIDYRTLKDIIDELAYLKGMTSRYLDKTELTLQMLTKKIEENPKLEIGNKVEISADLQSEENFDFTTKIENAMEQFLDQPEHTEYFDSMLHGAIPINLSLECVTCGITYTRDVKQILIPIDLADLRKSKTSLADNGIILFSEEITCPICFSFKFAIDPFVYMRLTAILYYAQKLEAEGEYSLSDMQNPVVMGSFKSNIINDANTIPEAIEKISKLIQKNPYDVKYLIGKGNMLLWLNDYNEAIKTFKEVLVIDQDNIDALYNIVKIYFGRKNKSLFEKYVNQIIEIFSKKTSVMMQNLRFVMGLEDMLHLIRDRRIHERFKKTIKKLTE